MNTLELRESTLQQEGVMRVSKYLSSQALLSPEEMEALMEALPRFHIVAGSGLVEKGAGLIHSKDFLEIYRCYIQDLKEGKIPDEKKYRERFSDMWTVSTDFLYSIPVEGERCIIRSNRPVLQLQAHSLAYSTADGKFRPMVLGKGSVSWGIQFSYPQMYQDPTTGSLHKVVKGEEFPNTDLFKQLQRWLRAHSLPTPFVVQGTQTNVPMRIGKQCLSWINQHPQLREKEIQVVV